MKTIKFTFVLLGVAMILLSFTYPNSASGPDPAVGKKIFKTNLCVDCHGIKGKPVLPGVPNFYKGERLEKDDETLMEAIRMGNDNPENPIAPEMPPYGGGPELSDEQLVDVLAYIRTLPKNS